MPQILASGAETVVTCGAMQSNFIRQLAASCAVFNLKLVAACMNLPYISEDKWLPFHHSGNDGNLYLDRYFGLERRRFPDGTWDQLDDYRDEIAKELEAAGRKVFVVKLGGGSPQGVHAFFLAGEELLRQTPADIDQIVVASSSGSTQVGLAHRFMGTSTRVIGMACDPEPDIPEDLAELSREYADAFGGQPLEVDDFDFRLDWVGPGYGVPSEAGDDAVKYLASREGILLDQVYSGKAFAGMLDLARAGGLPGRTVFWHTGGVPSLFTAHL